jgi:asparagine synthase (glutamine-hydrolysing)
MCGIAGIISKKEIARNDIVEITHALSHRGPDSENIIMLADNRVAFGHTRLSIIDLSARANQPMQSADLRYTLIFNGEIYNFQTLRKEIELKGIISKTTSDTEVILNAFQLWGDKMVSRLQGMFSIAIYDSMVRKVFLFRDRVGKKPLFYFQNHEHFMFASEIKSFLKHPALQSHLEVDKEAIHEFMHLGYIPEPKTIYRSIRKFPAGFVGEVHDNLSQNFYPYWNIDDCIDGRSLAHADLADTKNQLGTLLHKAVQKRLISDVPLGTFLSGGTDSSLITAIASKNVSKPLKTFNIGFKESKFDEHVYASRVAKHLNTDHHEYILSETEAASILEKYLFHLDEPFADTSAIPTMLVSELARKEVTVALTGDGGDELFLGYGTYTWANRLKNPAFKAMQTLLASSLNFGNARLKRVSRLLRKVPKSQLRSHIFSQEQYFFSAEEIRESLASPFSYQPFRYVDPAKETALLTEAGKQSLFDLKYYLKDDLLVKVDRASMYYGLECRCPLLDEELVQFALNINERFKVKRGTNKWLLKEILKTYLPDDLVNRQKWGFSIPLSRWLKNEFRYLIDENLNQQAVEEIGVIKYDFVKKLLDSFMAGEDYLYNRIWILVVLHKWLRRN